MPRDHRQRGSAGLLRCGGAGHRGCSGDRFDLRVHRPTYLLLGRYSDNVNQNPFTPMRATPPVYLDLNQTEPRFRISFKPKLLDLERQFDMLLTVWAA